MKIGLVPRTPTSAVSFYRTIGCFGDIQRKYKDFNFSILPEVNWAICKEIDLLFVARPNTQNDLTILKIAKRCNLPIILDWDDDPFTVPLGNPAYHHHQQSVKIMEECLKLPDHIICSTKAVEDAIKPYNSNTTVIPNAFDNTLFNLPTEFTKRRKNIIWRGGSSHREDVLEHTEALIAAAKAFPDWQFIFIGDTFGSFEGIPNVQFVVFTDLIQYMDLLQRLEPAIVIVPLKNNEFNKAKSNIAWIEATFAGASTLAPAWSSEWDKPGIIKYKDKKDFGFKLQQMIREAQHLPNYWQSSMEYIRDNLLLTELNKVRYSVIMGIARDYYENRDKK